jgi:hypothetical protein
MNPQLGESLRVGSETGEAVVNLSAGEMFRLPASAQQERYALFDKEYPESRVWNVAARWSLRGPLNVEALKRAMNAVCARHEALRTCLEFESGEYVQKVAAELSLPVPVVDLREVNPDERDSLIDELATLEAKAPFVLRQGPLFRARLLQVQDDHYVLMVTLHHTIADGYSLGVLSRELGVYYKAFLTITEPELAELPVQFADFVIWQKESFEKGAFEPQISYWKKQLRGLVPLQVSGDLVRPPQQTWNGTIVSELLPRVLSDSLAQVSQS